ncbi:MAG TPA: energy-coupling factor transporter transmembrane component T [Chitinispirillaceae bacterium]|nr:energy-coupling factor transporter transmembrane component T [Chitinispirillaceae bacterium]
MISIESLSHSLRLKQYQREIAVFCLLSLIVAIGAPPWPGGVIVIGAVWGLAIFGAGLPVLVALRIMTGPVLFLGVTVLSLCFGVGWNSHGPYVVWSQAGFQTASQVMLRSSSAVSSMLVLTLLVPVHTLFSILDKTRVPAFILEFIAIVYRMIFLLEQSRVSIYRAQTLRQGYDGWRNSLRSISMLSSNLFIRSHLHAIRLNHGLESRGYDHSLAVLRIEEKPNSIYAMVLAILVPCGIALISFGIRYLL